MPVSPSVLITGCSSGLGKQIAEQLARCGMTVFASMRDIAGKNQQAAAALRELAAREEVALYPIELDVTDSASVERGISAMLAQTGRIDVVINNAAVGLTGLIEACTIDQIQAIFTANVFGALRVNQAALPSMRQQRSGLIIYISSTSTQVVVPFLGVYGATKAALESLAVSSHYELFSLGIDTVIVQLGAYATSFGVNLQHAGRQEIESAYGMVGQIAQGFAAAMSTSLAQTGNPADVANQIADLIALPAGQRPRKIIMGLGGEGLEPLNQNLAALQHQFIESFGFGALVQRTGEQNA